MANPQDSTPAPAPVDPADSLDSDDLIKRCTEILARMRELLPLAKQIDAVVDDIMPEKPSGRRRYRDPDDETLYASLQGLPVGIADYVQTAIENVESDLETAQEDAKDEARAELAKAEERVRELKRRLGEEPASDKSDKERTP
jgi:hypothetical protein